MAVVAATAMVLCAPRVAHGFDNLACKPGTTIQFPYLFDGRLSDDFRARRFLLPPGFDGMGDELHTLPNNVVYPVRLAAQPNVYGVQFGFTSFDTEQGHDALFFIGTDNGTLAMSGPLCPTATCTVPLNSPPVLRTDTVTKTFGETWDPTMLFTSDGQNPSNGFAMTTATVTKCGTLATGNAPPDIPSALVLGRRSIGFAFQQGETVYFEAPQLPNAHGPLRMHLAVNAIANPIGTPGGSIVGFNVYERCGAFPTQTTSDHMTSAATDQAFFDFDVSNCHNKPIYIAVDATVGSGAFDIMASVGTDVTLCAALDPRSVTGQSIVRDREMIERATRTFFGTTAGAVLFNQIFFASGAGSDCGLGPIPQGTNSSQQVFYLTMSNCVSPADLDCQSPPVPSTTTGGDPRTVRYCNDFIDCRSEVNFQAHNIAHEFGHAVFELPDEHHLVQNMTYDAAQCGHSIMGKVDAHFTHLCTSPCTCAAPGDTGCTCPITACSCPPPSLTGPPCECIPQQSTHLFDHEFSPQTFFSGHANPPQAPPLYADPGPSFDFAMPFGDSESMWAKLVENDFGPQPLDFADMRQMQNGEPENYDYSDFDFNSSAPGTVTVTILP